LIIIFGLAIIVSLCVSLVVIVQRQVNDQHPHWPASHL
jgi:hypothetical protein